MTAAVERIVGKDIALLGEQRGGQAGTNRRGGVTPMRTHVERDLLDSGKVCAKMGITNLGGRNSSRGRSVIHTFSRYAWHITPGALSSAMTAA